MIRLPACCSSPRKVQDVRQNNERKQFTLRLLFKPLWLSLFKEGGRVQGGRRKPQGGLGVARSQVGWTGWERAGSTVPHPCLRDSPGILGQEGEGQATEGYRLRGYLGSSLIRGL